MTRSYRFIFQTVVLLSVLSCPAAAGTISEYTAGTVHRINLYPGESFTTPSGPGWDDLTFSWFVEINGSPKPAAFGTIFLLSQPYAGTPPNLSYATPGYVDQGSPNSSNSEYVFDVTATIQPNTTYYFYANSFNVIYGSENAPGTTFYFAGGPKDKYHPFTNESANYVLSGDPVGPRALTPEPSSAFLEIGGIVLLGLIGGGRVRIKFRR
ncbi:MAG: hypothetical protein JO033_11510 [Acidobacteriaceae bacterium]|nr:hypothetical protein [Acidobacteriaceae bacterium]MBV9500115.1 hypothetical protein [Acidobacteriaceae bacterium]